MNTREKFYKRNWFIYLMLILFPPAGIILLWLFNKSSTKTKGILSVVSAIWLVIALLTGDSNDDTTILVENENIIESTIIENSSVDNNTIENNIIENIETTTTSEVPETESIEFSMPESTDDIQVKQEPKSEDIHTLEPKSENHADNNSDSTVSNDENILNSTASDNNNTSTPEQSVQPSNDTPDTIIASNVDNDNNNFNIYDNTDQQNTTDQYVLNTRRDTIHIPSCRSVPTIAPDNYATSNQSIEELEAQGYHRCGICLK